MQQLHFEDAWNRTISNEDRLDIKKIFEQTKKDAEDGVTFVPVRTAVNHRNDLLITTLIHNFQSEETDLTNINIQLFQDNKRIASQYIEESRLCFPAKTSMPWTFIFPEMGDENKQNVPYSLKVGH
ncbi:SLAP domain-containing protein [Gracilibacillus thailandensis]|uniref:SLAP domain-containing protein n=1 Tax=Gracilibacillus thailandensis TaxID=563735 RepID=A0A6N7QZA6_9BACI|nr:SLAP domain-containing protein [Gracilibacillus thailandensis]MRI66834.1 SLAP domain-containing protein [Gracilibacillus thailandensis]